MTREEIFRDCPTSFVSTLTEIIDSIESDVGHVCGLLEIRSITDIGDILTALNDLNKLYEDLY